MRNPTTVMSLLWRAHGREPTRGPRPGRSVDQVVEAAVALADAEGLAAVSIRAVARSLSVAPMSIYTYVPGKADLLDLMIDWVYLRMDRASLADLPWRERLTRIADENRALYHAHPWLGASITSRPQLGPGLVAKYDHELAAFDGLGLTDLEIDDSLTYLLMFVDSYARADLDTTERVRATGMTDDEWWAAHGPLLAEVLDPADHPTAARVGQNSAVERGAAFDADHAYRFGLARVLDGLAPLIER